MINYGTIYSDTMPQKIEITKDMVFLANAIKSYTKTVDEHEVSGYQYDCVGYTKDEYIRLLAEQNNSLQNELLDTQSALCDVYELIEGGVV